MRNYKESDIQNSQNERLDDNRGVPSMPNIKLYVEKLKRYLDIYSHASISNRTDDGVKDVYTQYEIEKINKTQGIIKILKDHLEPVDVWDDECVCIPENDIEEIADRIVELYNKQDESNGNNI